MLVNKKNTNVTEKTNTVMSIRKNFDQYLTRLNKKFKKLIIIKIYTY